MTVEEKLQQVFKEEDVKKYWSELNDAPIDKTEFRYRKEYYFKCANGFNHPDFLKKGAKFLEHKNCPLCRQFNCNNNFGDYLIKKYGENAMEERWSDKNSFSPYEISPNSCKEVWFKCVDSNGRHEDFMKFPHDYNRNDRCPICAIVKNTKNLKQGLKEKYGDNAMEKYWSDKNMIHIEDVSYKSNIKEVYFKCPNFINHPDFLLTPFSFLKAKEPCPICNNTKVLKEFNSFWALCPDQCKYIKNIEDSFNAHQYSHEEVEIKCPYCGREGRKTFYELVNWECTCLSDNISFPEKVLISFLKEANISFEKEYSPSWGDKKRYDFYLKDYNLIIEVDGLQHKKQVKHWHDNASTLEDRQKLDKLKEQRALEHGIKTIRINAEVSDFVFIKKNIENSELKNIIDLEKFDWKNCELNSLKSYMVKVCELWKQGKTINEIIENKDAEVNNRKTIKKYLERGNELGLCNYNREEEKEKNIKKTTELMHESTCRKIKVIEVKTQKEIIFSSLTETSKYFRENFGLKTSNSSIIRYLEAQKEYQGYIFLDVID